MKFDKKNWIYILISIFILFLCIHYWAGFEAFLIKLIPAVTPLIIGCVIAYILNILMSFYEKHYLKKLSGKKWVIKTKRPVCLTAAIFTLFAIIALIILLVIPELVSCVKLLLSEIPPAVEKLMQNETFTKVLPDTIEKTLSGVDWRDYASKIISVLTSGIGNAAETIFAAITSIISLTATIIIGIIFSIYILAGKESLSRKLKKVMANYMPKKIYAKTKYVISVFNKSFYGYIVGQCTEAVILGVLCIIGMLIFRFPYAIMIGTLIGFTALIPIAGAYIGAGIGAIMILTVSPIKALLFILFIIVLQQIEGNLIYPKVVGEKLGLPAVFVLAAITIFGSLFGIPGMLIGVPLTSAIYSLIADDIKTKSNI